MVSQKKEKEGRKTTMENLPDEVLPNIFIRLLAKQLAQMRCVCKSWNTLLSESSFIKSHLHRSIHHNDQILLFFRCGLSIDSRLITARSTRSPDLELTNFIKPPVIPQRNKSRWDSVIGSVNGLICFSYTSDRDDVVTIWNPSLSAVLTLPPSSFPSRHLNIGFGFDPKTDDYKVVKLASVLKPYESVAQGEVYSLRKGSWKLVYPQRFFSNRIAISGGGGEVCVVNGHMCRIGSIEKKIDGFWKDVDTIVAFDLGAETFSEIPLPDSLHHIGYLFNVLGVLAGKLCVMPYLEGGEFGGVWVMDEYGVSESWVKHYAFSQFNGGIVPCGFTLHNEFLFKVDVPFECYTLYDPVVGKSKTFNIMGEFGVSKVVEYVDSLVWVAPAKRQKGYEKETHTSNLSA